MENFSIVMMGVGPYITSSIIFQLLAMLIPKLEEMNKEEAGRQKLICGLVGQLFPLPLFSPTL